MKHTNHFHGSDLEKIEQIYHIEKDKLISFSANVNPLGLSTNLRTSLTNQLDVITTYPDREYTALRETISNYCDIDSNHIIVGNGSTELISLFIQLKRPKKALIIGPTYSEYEREISLGNGASLDFPLNENDDFQLNELDLFTQLNDGIDLLVICNPNNPTSTAITQYTMRKILDVCKRYDIFVMVDETYVEFAENYNEITAIPLTNHYNNLIILRGISKFFAAPGLRLGYAITGNRDLVKAINSKKNPWTINSLADLAGQLLFTDTDYINATIALISSERRRIFKILQEVSSIKVYPPSGNFILVRIINEIFNADDIFEAAIHKQLIIRNCSSFPFLDNQYFRFCFMNPSDNDKLLACIIETLA